MKRIDTKFLFLAALMLAVGVGMGSYMAGSKDFVWRPVHTHINLVGWVSLALFGLTYRAYPALQKGWLATFQFALAAPAALIFPFGIYLAVVHHSETVVMFAGIAWALSVLLFVAQMARLAFGGVKDNAATTA